VESKADQLDAVTSTSTRDGHADKLGESSTACLPTFDSSRMTFDSECRDCRLRCKNLQPDNLVMYLHAYCYQVRFCHGKYTYSMRYKVRLHIICLIVTLLKCLNDSDMRYPDHCVWLGCLQSLPLQATQFSGLFLDMRLFYCWYFLTITENLLFFCTLPVLPPSECWQLRFSWLFATIMTYLTYACSSQWNIIHGPLLSI